MLVPNIRGETDDRLWQDRLLRKWTRGISHQRTSLSPLRTNANRSCLLNLRLMVDHEVDSSGHESQAHAEMYPMITSNLGPLHALCCLELFYLFLGATGALRAANCNQVLNEQTRSLVH